jgi:hypothetical protein
VTILRFYSPKRSDSRHFYPETIGNRLEGRQGQRGDEHVALGDVYMYMDIRDSRISTYMYNYMYFGIHTIVYAYI